MLKIKSPFNESDIRKLVIGDKVLISGRIITGRDAVHKYLHDGNISPIDLTDQIIYHVGPVIIKDESSGEYKITAAGPTTSIREEPYEWELIKKYHLKGVIGKGGMGEKTLKACSDYGCVYFHAIGGAAQVLAEKVVKVVGVHLMELGSPEAMWELDVVDFPVVVTMDSHGNSLHDKILKQSEKKLKELLYGEDNG